MLGHNAARSSSQTMKQSPWTNKTPPSNMGNSITNWLACSSRLHAPQRPPAPGPPKILAARVDGRRPFRSFWRMIGRRTEARCVRHSLTHDLLAAVRSRLRRIISSLAEQEKRLCLESRSPRRISVWLSRVPRLTNSGICVAMTANRTVPPSARFCHSRRRRSERRPSLAPLAPHQPRPTRDAPDALERGGVAHHPSRAQAGARAAERDPPKPLQKQRRQEIAYH